MATQLTNSSNSLETSAVADYVLARLRPANSSMSSYFSKLFLSLEEEENKLSKAIGIEKKGNYTEELLEADHDFNEQFKCVKLFINANQHSSIPERREAADSVYRIFELNNPNLHRLGYAIETAAAKILLEDLEKPDVQANIAILPSVADEIAIFKAKNDAIVALLDKRTENVTIKEEITPSYLQRKVVRDILNSDLLPFLESKSLEEPEVYGLIAAKIETYISEMNANIKLRIAKPSSNEPKAEEEEKKEGEE